MSEKGKIIATFFIDKNRKFKADFNIKEEPNNMVSFIYHAFMSTGRIYKILKSFNEEENVRSYRVD